MADLAVGLAKSVVDGALSKAQSAVKEDSKLRQSAQRDLVFITGEFQMMQSFLKLADDERTRNIVVRTWVLQIRDLAYDVEDCIEFVVHLDNKSHWWRRLLPSFVAAATQPLDEAVAEIQQLKARVEYVSSRNARYSLISDSGSKPADVQQQQPAAARAAMGEAASFNMLVEATDTKKHGDLIELITMKDDDGLQVISVWGTCGDLGTTSIIRKAYNDPEICEDFTCRAWVKLTHPFNPHEFIRGLRLSAQFRTTTCEELHEEALIGVLTRSEATQDDYLKEFVRRVNDVRYLIVLEDLSTMAEWDAIRTFLPDRKNGSWIMASTQQFEIASLCVGHSYQVLELKQFSADHSVYAFIEGSQGDRPAHQAHKGLSYQSIHTSKNNAAFEWMEKNPVTGRQLEMNELRQYTTIARFHSFQVLSVWGIAGVGKSTLVRNLYCDRILDTTLFEIYGWADVSHPFNLREFSRSLLLDFHSESLQAKEAFNHGMTRFSNPIEECRDLLEQHCCLVVIDDLQSKKEWNLIKAALLSRSSRSVIIVVTSEASIATSCADKEGLILNVKGLQADASFSLFHQEVQRKNPYSPMKDLREEVKLHELILKCGGLPKVLVAIAGVLSKKTVTLMDTICLTNDRFMQTLESNPEYISLRVLIGWMYSYFRSWDSLKPLIFYVSIFARDHSIRRRRVVRRWVAEGYSRDSEDKSAEKNGEMFFSKLLDMSIIQRPPQSVSVTIVSDDTRMSFFCLNGFIREYILSRPMEENLVFELEGCCDITTQRTGRHLIIRESWDRDKIVFQSMDFSKLRSLTVFGKWKQFFVSESMKLLRVLDLENSSDVEDADLEQMLKLLRRLKFLSLRGCRQIGRLPSSVGELRQLQTLDMRHTSIVKLPGSITKLQKLQYIRVGTSVQAHESSTPSPCLSVPKFCGRCCKVGVMVPGGINKLTTVHTLGVVNIGASGGKAILKELEDLTQLRKLGVSGINRRNCKKFSSAISGHAHLEYLSVQLDKDSQSCLSGIVLPLKTLQSFKLHGPVESLPVLKIDELSKLTKLDLEMTILTVDDIKLIGSLSKLCTLRIKLLQDSEVHFCVKQNGLELLTYREVKVLEIASNSRLNVTFGTNTMIHLELLKAHCCNGSSVKFSNLNNLIKLKVLLLKGSYDDTLMQELESQLAGNPNEPVLKLEE